VTTTENIVATVLILLSPIGLLYGWFFYLTRMRHEPRDWRSWITLTSLTLASLAILSWPVTALLAPKADWGTHVGVRNRLAWVEALQKPILRTLSAAIVLCLFGRPRLILPIAVACVGAALVWVFSTIT